METVSLILIIVGLAIIGAVVLMRWRLRRQQSRPVRSPVMPVHPPHETEDFDPLFAIDRRRDARLDLDEPITTREERTAAPAVAEDLPRVVATDTAQAPTPPAADAARPPAAAPRPQSAPLPPRRRAPRTATDPERVIAMNVMAPEGQRFGGEAIAAAAQRAGMELGTWSIYHYYSHHAPETPPLFSMANMIKPGSFDPERLHEISTVGLSLFMVPANDDNDLAAFDVMLATVRQLASELGGDVRDARRSVLTRQAIEHLREQLNEWRLKARTAQS